MKMQKFVIVPKVQLLYRVVMVQHSKYGPSNYFAILESLYTIPFRNI